MNPLRTGGNAVGFRTHWDLPQCTKRRGPTVMINILARYRAHILITNSNPRVAILLAIGFLRNHHPGRSKGCIPRGDVMIDAIPVSDAVTPWASEVARVVVGAVLAVAATAKLMSLSEFRKGITALHLGGRLTSGLIALAIPLVESAVALLLLTNAETLAASVGATVLFLTFACVIASRLRPMARPLSCRCLGVPASLDSWAVLRNIGLAVLAFIPIVGGGQEVMLLGSAVVIACGLAGTRLRSARFSRDMSVRISSAT